MQWTIFGKSSDYAPDFSSEYFFGFNQNQKFCVINYFDKNSNGRICPADDLVVLVTQETVQLKKIPGKEKQANGQENFFQPLFRLLLYANGGAKWHYTALCKVFTRISCGENI